jgi:hypothetical protein
MSKDREMGKWRNRIKLIKIIGVAESRYDLLSLPEYRITQKLIAYSL